MADAHQADAWAHTSNLLAMTFNRHRGSEERALSADDFNPMRSDAARPKASAEKPTLSIRDLRGAMMGTSEQGKPLEPGALIGGGTRPIAGPLPSMGPLP